MSQRHCAASISDLSGERTQCDWTSDPEGEASPLQQAVEHATAAGHPLCITCTRSLRHEERQTCERCISRAQTALREIVELYALLPEQIGHAATQVYDRQRTTSGDDTTALPGGNVLVLLGRGGTGDAGRRLTRSERARGLEQGIAGREHMEDNKPEDGASVVHQLATWEDDWRHTRGEPAASDALLAEPEPAPEWWLPGAVGPLSAEQLRRRAVAQGFARGLTRALAGPSLTERTVMGAAGYLERRMRWAATEHPTFDEFMSGLSTLRTQLQHATSTSELPMRAPAPCLDCGRKTIERTYRRPDACTCDRPPRITPDGPEPRYIRVERHRAYVEAWEKAHETRCDQGGLVERWTCSTCEREYTDQQYNLALADWMRKVSRDQPDAWLRPVYVATMLQVTPKTVRHWIERLQVAAYCDVLTHRVFVWWPDARDEAARIAAKRQRRASA